MSSQGVRAYDVTKMSIFKNTIFHLLFNICFIHGRFFIGKI